ncbi:MAG: FAD-dependent oxidoreductase [Burkholderiaceae bacterium]
MTLRVAVVGGGWAGMAAAIEAAGPGVALTLFEASRTLGGRARALPLQRPDGRTVRLDNGQHILIGAYHQTLACMQDVGIPLHTALLPLPLGLPFPDGTGLQSPAWVRNWPAQPALLATMLTARGWRWTDRMALVRTVSGWRRRSFRCQASDTAADVCRGLGPRVMADLIEPLCVSALNLPTRQASGSIFLRVMQDAMLGTGFGHWRASTLLLPRIDLGSLFPERAAQWLVRCHGAGVTLRTGTRVTSMQRDGSAWRLKGPGVDQTFDQVIWATTAAQATQAMASTARTCPADTGDNAAQDLLHWSESCAQLDFTAITTVYAWSAGLRLPGPMLALREAPGAPPQFVFDRGQLAPDDPAMQGILAFVISASQGGRDDLEQAVMRQAREQLGLTSLAPFQTLVDRRATFACTPGIRRPAQCVTQGILAAGDYVDGPYPATLEAAVRSGQAAGKSVRDRVRSAQA